MVATTLSGRMQRTLNSVCCLLTSLAFVNMLSSGKHTLKNISGRPEEIKELSDALVKRRKAFLDRAVFSTQSTVFQILDDVVKLSTQFQALSSQVSDRP